MKKRIYYLGVLPAFFFAGSMALTSCSTDENIDIDSVDTTIGVKLNNFTVPLGKSEDIKLGDVLDLKEDDCIRTTASGDYEFFKEGDDVQETDVNVDPVKFSNPITQSFDFEFTPTANARTSRRALPEVITVDKQKINAFNFSNDETIKEVESLTHASVSSKIKLELKFGSVKDFTKKVSLTLEFPSYLELELDNTSLSGISISGNKLSLTDIETNADLSFSLKLNGIKDFESTKPATGDYVVVNPNEISMNGTVYMDMSIKSSDLNVLDLDDPIAVATLMGKKYTMSAKVIFDDDITLTEATGYFNPTIELDDIGDIEIGDDVPDFLKDDDEKGDVNLTLSNPNITLSVESNIDAIGILNATLTAYYEKKGKPTETKTMTLKKIMTNPHKGDISDKTKTTIYICRKAEGAPAGATVIVKDGTDGDLDIAELLRQIPDKITFKCDASADKTYLGTIKLGTSTSSAKYTIKPSYSFGAPLSLEAGSSIVYDDKTDGFYEDIKDNDIDFRGEAELVITGKITNKSPLELVLESEAVDVNKNKITGISLTKSNVIKSNLDGSAPSTLSITLKKDANVNLKDVKFDGIKFKAKATSVNATTLNKNNHTIKLEDLKIGVKGEISIDTDKKK